MLRIAFRVDASVLMGSGHVRRCQSLARALEACGAQVRWVSRALDAAGPSLLQAVGASVHWLPAPAAYEATDARATCEALQSVRPDMVVVDHYDLGAPWHRAVREGVGCAVAVIDDLANRLLAPDILIDHNLRSDGAYAHATLCEGSPKMLLGPEFALLDMAYARAPRYAFKDPVQSIGIFMGGADTTGAGRAALLACREVAGFKGRVEVVSPPLGPEYPQLKAECPNWPDTVLVDSLPDLAGFFARHDLQIGAGGGATWERCCMGVPTIGCVLAENQVVTVPELAARGALAWAQVQDADALAGGFVPGLTRAIGAEVSSLLVDTDRRRQLGVRAADLVDGRGVERVAAVLACRAGAGVKMRPAQATDEDVLLLWANDPQVRAHAFHPSRIEAEDHTRWFRKRMADPSRYRLYVAEAPNGVLMGQARFERGAQGWEIGYALAPLFRGLGIGRAFLRAAIDAQFARCGGEQLVGRVKQDNPASVRVFHGLGFHQERVQDERGDYWLFSMDRSAVRNGEQA